MGIFNFHFKILYRIGINVDDVRSNFTSGQFLDQQSCPFQCIDDQIGVGTSFKAKRRIGVDSVPASGFADENGIEAGTFQKDVGCLFCNAAFKSAEHTCYTHRFFGIAYHQIVFIQFAFYAVQCDKRSAGRETAYNNLITFYLVLIEGVERLAQFEEDKICNVYDVVDRIEADGFESGAQPFR